MKPLLSVVIPTKKTRLDRIALFAINSVLNLKSDKIELILHVDKDGEPEEGFRVPSDSRLRYIEHPKPVPMTENWNLAMSHVRGKYVMYLGDDDAVLPNIIDVATWADSEELDCVKQTGNWLYYWPTYPDARNAGTLIALRPSGSVKYPNIAEIAKINSYGPKMDRYELQPDIYYALIKKTIVDAMFQKTGKYFGSIIPDLYFAFAIAPFIGKYAIVDYPYALAGHAGKANAARFVQKRMKEQEAQYALYEWAPGVPRTNDFVSFYADSKYKAYFDSGQLKLIRNINAVYVFAQCLLNRPWSSKKTSHLLEQLNVLIGPGFSAKTWTYAKLLFYVGYLIVLRVNLKLPYTFHVFERNHNELFKKKTVINKACGNISEAVTELLLCAAHKTCQPFDPVEKNIIKN